MRSVLISIRPKWCELIAKGQKTVEVRKTRPKLETPFKVYIYMTAGDAVYPVTINGSPYTCSNVGGKCVIGEFVCDEIREIGFSPYNHGEYTCEDQTYIEQTGLTFDEMFEYLDEGYGYGWHISDLVIYDTPKEWYEFYRKCEKFHCEACEHLKFQAVNSSEYDYDCEFINGKIPITRPPQSWCYVEEVSQP